MNPSKVVPVVIEQPVLSHCGRRMRCQHTSTEGATRIRYYKCLKCGRTEKAVSEIPGFHFPPIYSAAGGAPRHCTRDMQDRGNVELEQKLYRAWRCEVCGKEVKTLIRYLRANVDPEPLFRGRFEL